MDTFNDNLSGLIYNRTELDKLNILSSQKRKEWYKKFMASHNIYMKGIDYYRKQMFEDDDITSENYIQNKKKMDKLFNKKYELDKEAEQLKFESDIYSELADFHCDKMNSYDKKLDKEDYITTKNTEIKKITKTKKNQLEKEICSICLEHHDYKQMVSLNCGHVIGKACCKELIESKLQMRCPLCRTKCDKYYLLRLK